MSKPKGRNQQYREAGFLDDEEDFEPDKLLGDVDDTVTGTKSRGHGATRQRLEMRTEEQWLRKQLSDWDDDFVWSDGLGAEDERVD